MRRESAPRTQAPENPFGAAFGDFRRSSDSAPTAPRTSFGATFGATPRSGLGAQQLQRAGGIDSDSRAGSGEGLPRMGSGGGLPRSASGGLQRASSGGGLWPVDSDSPTGSGRGAEASLRPRLQLANGGAHAYPGLNHQGRPPTAAELRRALQVTPSVSPC